VHECPKLIFLDDTSPIYLHTDASQYGMGAYLFQVREGKEIPIRFLSKSFDTRMSKWSTIQQEGYAIYYAITSWEYLLRDRKFLVRSDHANLRLLHAESDKKVIRWMITLQSYDFDIEHIAGKDNEVADGFSRLCQDVNDDGKRGCKRDFTENERGEWNSSDPIGLINLLEVMNFTESPCVIPKAFIALQSNYFEVHMELFAMTVTQYDTLSDRQIQDYIGSIHNDVAGHFLLNKTLDRLRKIPAISEALKKEPILGRGLRARCRRFINECPACQKHTFERVVNSAVPFTVSEYFPNRTAMIDYIEKLPEDADGNMNIVVIVDCFSRFCTLQATKSTQSTELARKLLFHSSFFGMPTRLVSDKGPALISNLMKDFMALVGTEHVKTMAASKEENSIVERLNREVMRHLRNLVFDRQVYDNWSHMLPFINRILITTIHSATGVTPAEVMFGSSVQLERGIISPLLTDELNTLQKTCTYPEYITKMWASQQSLISKARENLQAKDTKHMAKKNEENDGDITTFPVDSYVLAEPLNYFTVRKEPNKLKPILKGPFKIVAISDDNAKYTVLNLVTMRLRVYHVSALRAFNARPEDHDLTKYAVRDYNFYMVRSVKGFRPKTFTSANSRKILQFEIEWDIDGSTTWEPWSAVRTLGALHTWVHSAACTNKALKALFPINRIEEEKESDEENERGEEAKDDQPYWPAI
jgi:hypothetical protein